jgi:dihydroorotase
VRAALAVWLAAAAAAAAGADDKPFDLLIRGGHVIDPKNGVDAVLDVAVASGKIARVAAGIPEGQGRAVVDASGLYVVPGLVDIHAHVFHGTEPDAYLSNGFVALAPDGFTFRSGVTTVADAGGAGWRNFRQFKEQVVDRSRTRVLAFLNIVGSGMKGGPVEQNVGDMDARLTAARIAEFKELIVGVKTAHYEGGFEAVDRAVEAGTLAHVPVMVDFGKHDPPLSLDDLLLTRLRPGDIFTHVYAAVDGRMSIVDERGQVRASAWVARKRGVLFDVGHGARSFSYRQAVPALKQGLLPDSISTDLHAESMNAGMKDMLNVMSKMMALGMSLPDVVLRSTWNPAREIQRADLGHLSPGAAADVAVLRVREGSFGFLDAAGERRAGSQRLEAELTLRDGQVVWDLNGLLAPATSLSAR